MPQESERGREGGREKVLFFVNTKKTNNMHT
jgi:hypothetical protein